MGEGFLEVDKVNRSFLSRLHTKRRVNALKNEEVKVLRRESITKEMSHVEKVVWRRKKEEETRKISDRGKRHDPDKYEPSSVFAKSARKLGPLGQVFTGPRKAVKRSRNARRAAIVVIAILAKNDQMVQEDVIEGKKREEAGILRICQHKFGTCERTKVSSAKSCFRVRTLPNPSEKAKRGSCSSV